MSWLEARHGLIQNVENVVGLLCRVVAAASLTIVCNIFLDLLCSLSLLRKKMNKVAILKVEFNCNIAST